MFQDIDLILKDAGLVASSGVATVDGSAKVVDLGAGLVMGELYLDVTAIEIADDDELYTIRLQGSNSATFASGYEDLLSLDLGAAEVLSGDKDSETGRYLLPFRTEKNGTTYRYVRLYTTVDGTVGTGINYSAWLAK